MDTWEENVQPDAYRTMRCLRLAQDNLRMGYTTVRDLGDRNNIVLSVTKGIREGMAVGPDILASGMILSPTEAGNDFFGGDVYRSGLTGRIYKSGTSPVSVGCRLD